MAMPEAVGEVTIDWRGEAFLEWADELIEEKLEQTLEICVDNTKEHIKQIDLRETGTLHDSITYWEPRREGRYLVGSFGVPQEVPEGHKDDREEMDYGYYQEVGFTHTNEQKIHNPYLMPGLRKSKPQIQAIWRGSYTSTKTFYEE